MKSSKYSVCCIVFVPIFLSSTADFRNLLLPHWGEQSIIGEYCWHVWSWHVSRFHSPPGGANDLLTSTTLVLIITSFIQGGSNLLYSFTSIFFLIALPAPFLLAGTDVFQSPHQVWFCVSASALCCWCCSQKYLVVLAHWKTTPTISWQSQQISSMGLYYHPLSSMAGLHSRSCWEFTASHRVRAKTITNSWDTLLKWMHSQSWSQPQS